MRANITRCVDLVVIREGPARALSGIRASHPVVIVAVAVLLGAPLAEPPVPLVPLELVAVTSPVSATSAAAHSGNPVQRGPSQDPIGGPRLGETALVVDLPDGVPAPPAFPASCYLVADVDTGAVILAKCPHAMGLPASTIKALTALALVDEFAPNEAVAAVAEDANQEGSKVGLVPGSSYTVDQLFQGMLLTSGNDAAWALARHRGVAQTIKAMNETADHLGAHDTRARNPSGLDAPEQVSSAYDLALIGRAVLRHEQLAQYVKTTVATFPAARVPGGGVRGSYQISNHNRLLTNYPGTIGVKNGYTVKARRTYIGAARRADAAYLITYLNNPAWDASQSTALLDWAFTHGKRARPVGVLVEPGSPEASQSPTQVSSPRVDVALDEAVPGQAAPPVANASQAGTQRDAPRVADPGAAGLWQGRFGWLGEHRAVLLLTGGSLAVVASIGIVDRRRRHD